MKLCIYTDPHYCAKSSILRKRGEKYTVRLENLIQSLNWVENLAETNSCEKIICLGDFFDKPNLDCEELTALNDVAWNQKMEHIFLVGNHESNVSSLEFSSTHLLKLCPGTKIIDKPTIETINNTNIVWLPYITEDNRKPLIEYMNPTKMPGDKTIIFSHNDLLGIQYGGFLSTQGFNVDELDKSCDVCINGHLHNCMRVTNKITNLGNLTGQNFSEDAFTYKHLAMIIDTDTLFCQLVKNPVALNFYKITSIDDIPALPPNSIITVKVKENLYERAKQLVAENTNILEGRILLDTTVVLQEKSEQIELTQMDHIEQFKTFVLQNLGISDIIKEELVEISK